MQHALHMRQAKAGMAGFCREEWFADLREVIRTDAASGILQRDNRLIMCGVITDANIQFPSQRHGLQRIEQELPEGILKLARIAGNQRKFFFNGVIDFNADVRTSCREFLPGRRA